MFIICFFLSFHQHTNKLCTNGIGLRRKIACAPDTLSDVGSLEDEQRVERDQCRFSVTGDPEVVVDTIGVDGVDVTCQELLAVRRTPHEQRRFFHGVEEDATLLEFIVLSLQTRRDVAVEVRTSLAFTKTSSDRANPNVVRQSKILRRLNQRSHYPVVRHGRVLDRRPIVAGTIETNRASADHRVAHLGFSLKRTARTDTNENPRAGLDCFRQNDPNTGTPHTSGDDGHPYAPVFTGVAFETTMLPDTNSVIEKLLRDHLRPLRRTNQETQLGETPR